MDERIDVDEVTVRGFVVATLKRAPGGKVRIVYYVSGLRTRDGRLAWHRGGETAATYNYDTARDLLRRCCVPEVDNVTHGMLVGSRRLLAAATDPAPAPDPAMPSPGGLTPIAEIDRMVNEGGKDTLPPIPDDFEL